MRWGPCKVIHAGYLLKPPSNYAFSQPTPGPACPGIQAHAAAAPAFIEEQSSAYHGKSVQSDDGLKLIWAQCHASTTHEGSQASSERHFPSKTDVTSKSPVGDISVVALIRTDTQSATKHATLWRYTHKFCHMMLSPNVMPSSSGTAVFFEQQPTAAHTLPAAIKRAGKCEMVSGLPCRSTQLIQVSHCTHPP